MRIILGLTGALIAIESLALLVGLCLIRRAGAWCTAPNVLFALTDIVGGSWLVLIAARSEWPSRAWVLGPAVVLLVTHTYREWQYLARAPNPFCANVPLFVLSNVRLAGLVAVVVVFAVSAASS